MSIKNKRFINFIYLVVIITFCYLAQEVIIPLLMAFFLYLIVKPTARKLENFKIPKFVISIAFTFLFISIIVAGVYSLSKPASVWISKAPKHMRVLKKKLQVIKKPMGDISKTTKDVQEMADLDNTKEEKLYTQKESLVSQIYQASSNFSQGLFIFIIFFYFLLSYGERLLIRVSESFDIDSSRNDTDLLRKVEALMSKYFLCVTTINILLGITMGFIFHMFNLPNPVLWGVMVTLLNFVPFLGFVVGVIIISLVCLVSFGDFWNIWLPPMFYFIINSIEGNLITPTILGRTMSLNPLVIFVTLLFATLGWGILGALISFPILAAIKIAGDQLFPKNRYTRILEI